MATPSDVSDILFTKNLLTEGDVIAVGGVYTIGYHYFGILSELTSTIGYQSTHIEYATFTTTTALQRSIFNDILHAEPSITYDYETYYSDVVSNLAFTSITAASADINIGQVAWDSNGDGTGDADSNVGAQEIDVYNPAQADRPEGPNFGYNSVYTAPAHGDVWLNSAYYLGWNNSARGGLQFYTVLHELGHALGLTHPNGALADPKYTIMADTFLPGMNGSNFVAPSNLQLFDILAMQEIFGTRNYATRSTATEYKQGQGFAGLATSPFIYAIWDGGGVDEIDASAYGVHAFIDLRQGRFSSIGYAAESTFDGDTLGSVGNFAFVTGQARDNVSIAYHTVIENAVGTSGSDVIVGNAWSNTLEGGDGADYLYGGGEAYTDADVGFVTADPADTNDPNHTTPASDSDILVGGAGDDVLNGGNGFDVADYSSSPEGVNVNLTAGEAYDGYGFLDSLTSIENAVLTQKDDVLIVFAPADLVRDGDGGFDSLRYASNVVVDMRNTDTHVWDTYGLSSDSIVDIEEVTVASSSYVATVLPDTSLSGAANYFNPYASAGSTFFLTSYRAVDYSASTSALHYETAPGAVSSATLGNSVTHSLRLSAGPSDDAYLYGSHHGDTFLFRPGGAGPNYVVTGTGDDVVSMYPSSGTGGLHVTYTGGDDTYYLTELIDEVRLAPTIQMSDITVGSITSAVGQVHAVLTIAGHGTLTLDYDDIQPYTIAVNLDAGGTIEFYAGSSTYNVIGTSSDVTLFFGSWGDDVWTGRGTLAETYYAKDGDDVLNGGAGNDLLNGGAGDDVLNGGAGSDTLQGEEGFDVASYESLASSITVNWSNGTVTSATGDVDALIGIESVIGSSQGDTQNGNSSGNTFGLSLGHDVITDTGGTDTLLLTSATSFETLIFSINGANLDIVLNAGTNYTTLTDQQGPDASKKVEFLQLHDGFRLDLLSYTAWQSVTSTWTGTSAAETAIGNSSANNLNGGSGADVLYGGDGADYVAGYDGDDLVHGGSGDDPGVRGGAGNDRLWGGAGADIIDGEGENDTLWGGAGINRLEGGDGNDELFGGDEGNATTKEQLRGEAGKDVLHGGAGVDEALGGSGDDFIYGNAGNDILYGGTGDDEIHGGDGDDLLNGEEGRDSLYGDAGNDTIYGSLDDNILFGGIGDDTLWGGYTGSDTFVGNDTLYGQLGNDTLNGVLGDDWLDGGDGDDTLQGNGGSDSYIVSSGTDYINDASGALDRLVLGSIDLNDVTFAASSGADTNDLIVTWSGGSVAIEDQAVSSGGPLEQLSVDDGFTLTFNGYLQWIKGTSAGATHNGGSGINVMLGYGGNDTLNGLANNDNLHGGDGNDTVNGGDDDDLVHGGDGTDTVNGDNGNDTLWGGNGNDALNGGAGDDTYIVTTGLETITESAGTDTIKIGAALLAESLSFANSGTDDLNITITAGVSVLTIAHQRSATAAEHVDTLLFDDGFQLNLANYTSWLIATSSGQAINGDNNNQSGVNTADVILGREGNNTLKGYDLDDQVAGGAGNDTIFGGTGNDVLHGETGDDTVYGEAGSDSLWGGSGADTLRGGDDNDTIRGGDGDDGALWGENGNDTLYGDAGNDSAKGDAGTDTLYGGDGNDTLYGGADADTLYGQSDDDILHGDAGTDTLYGGFNADELRGGADADTLHGESGDDRLYGDAAADTLYGGAGNDFLYGAGASDSTDADVLYGGDGDDWIYGQSGNDTLYGGLGADNLQGDAGADTYVWEAGSADDGDGLDLIYGFSTAQGDKIDISDVLQGFDPMTSLVTDFVRITTSGTHSVLELDANGGGNSFLHIGTIVNVTGLTDEAALLASGNLVTV